MSETILGGPDEKETTAGSLAKLEELEQRHTDLQAKHEALSAVARPSVERLLAAASHVNRGNQSLDGLVPALSEPTSTDLVEVVQIGARRRRWTELDPGNYASTVDDQCIVVKKRVRVQVEEEFRFSHPLQRIDPRWRIVGYDLATVQDAEPPKASASTKSPSWWTRLWNWLRGHSRLPEARLIAEKRP